MLLFQTQFTVNNTATLDQLIEIGIKWLDGSQHSQFKKSDFIKTDDEFSKILKNESIHIIRCINDKYEGVGIRYEKNGDRDDRWITEIVGAKFNNEYNLTFQLSWTSEIPSRQVPKAKKPYIVKQILDELGSGIDGDLKVLDKAYYLEEKDLEFVRKILNSETSNIMPVIYISVSDDNKTYIDPENVAHHLAGMAHVIVEPNRAFSYKIMELTSRQNVYLGAIGIYWPYGMGNTRLFPYGKYETPADLEKDITRIVKEALLSQQLVKEATWSYLKDLHFKTKIKLLRERDSTELEEYMSNFDGELEAKNERINLLESEINRLRTHIQMLNKEEQDVGSILNSGTEKELYPNEYNDLLITILNSEILKTNEDSRKALLLNNLIHSNKMSGYKDRIINGLKEVFDNFSKLSPRDKQILQDIGFTISEEGKHYKLIFKNDERYQFTVAKTASDHRAGKNNISTIKNKLFY